MSNSYSKMPDNENYNQSFNESLINLQKKKLNKLRNKYNKMIKNIENTDLEFTNLKDEMNFLNTIYYLNQNIDDLIENIENINLSLYEKREKIILRLQNISKIKYVKKITSNKS